MSKNNQNLALKYRPKTLGEIIGQEINIEILKAAVEHKTFKHAYLFAGNSGDGKTTTARAFASAINQGHGNPIEIDSAANNGVDNIRSIIANASQRAIDSEYKLIIFDEAHALTSDSWKTLLKTIEEPPEYTIFIFCTTEPSKIPPMILNRLQRYNFTAIKPELIKNRLEYICQQEGFINYEKTCDLISKIVHGCMRDAIMKLEQCADFSKDLSLDNAKKVIRGNNYENMFRLTWALQDKNEGEILNLIDLFCNEGIELKEFIDIYFEFVLDLIKYIIFQNITITNIPEYLATKDNQVVQQTVNIEQALDWFNALTDVILTIKTEIKYDTTYVSTIEAYLLRFCRTWKN